MFIPTSLLATFSNRANVKSRDLYTIIILVYAYETRLFLFIYFQRPNLILSFSINLITILLNLIKKNIILNK